MTTLLQESIMYLFLQGGMEVRLNGPTVPLRREILPCFFEPVSSAREGREANQHYGRLDLNANYVKKIERTSTAQRKQLVFEGTMT